MLSVHLRKCAVAPAALLVALASSSPRVARAQDTTAQRPVTPRALVTVGSPFDDDLRMMQLRTGDGAGYLLRSASSLGGSADSAPHLALVPPRVRLVHNSEHPYSLNDDGLWAGRGTNADVLFGALARFGAVRLAILPELMYSANRAYALTDPAFNPTVPARRSPFSSPWHAGAQSIDLPIRFGDGPIRRLGPGQSSLVVRAGPVEFGAASENEWWGPGLRNALLLSNNAEGFPHLLLRTAQPVHTRIGNVEARWLAGGLTESSFFDYDASNDLRSVSLLGVTLQPAGVNGLTVGAARAVYGPASSWGRALTSFPDALRDVGQPDAVPMTDSVSTGGKDQLFSLFARWIFPASGFETWAELGRAEFPVSLRDLLEQPNHTEAYTAGLQWLSHRVDMLRGEVRIQGEVSQLQQSTTFRFRPLGSWYTSHAVPQGYTQRGQALGAAIGPGSSSQWLAADLVHPTWQAGAYFSRVRWLEDAHSQRASPVRQRCTHDVSLLPGVRGRALTPLGTAFADYSSGWRLNRFFEAPGCLTGSDYRNRSLTLGFEPRLWIAR